MLVTEEICDTYGVS